MATPFSKSNLGTTPNQFTSSPHPSAVPMGRPLSHKSPSMRTPSASGPGHQNHPSISSHQYPTPLPVTTAALEDAAVFSSPSALLALGLGGITPSPAPNDALGGQGFNDGDLHSIAIPPLNITGPKDIDEERKKRIDEAVQLLRTRVAGRGVSREGVERLGRLEGLECMWQDNDLSIAGNSVDLEIGFEPGQETVKDVTLRYATHDAPEGERRVDASEVLKRNLQQAPDEQQPQHWKSMTGFHENLRRLARLDQLSREINCFEALEGIYECLQKVWEEEKRQGMQAGQLDHICKGWIGKPYMHRGKHIGLELEYWVEQRRILEAKRGPSEDAMELDDPAQEDDKGLHAAGNFWGANIECETGYPSLRVSKDWIESEVFTVISNEDGTEHDHMIKVINWSEPPATLISSLNNNAVALEPTMLSSTTPNIRFVARLDPPVDMPIFAAAEIFRILGVNMMQEFKSNTYDSLVVSSQGDLLNYTEPEGKQLQHRKEISTFDADGKSIKRQHTYTFNAFEQVPGRTIRDLPFSHPRQLSEVVPILRQYAFLSSLLRRTFADSKKEAKNISGRPAQETFSPPLYRESRPNGYFISNINPTEQRLDALLRKGHNNCNPSQEASPGLATKELRVDVSLRTPMSFQPSILLVFNIDEDSVTAQSRSARLTPRQAMIGVDIGLNGDINISHLSGLWPDTTDDVLEEERAAETTRLRTQISRVLETCEDFGTLVEWVLRRMRKLS
ncbi:predicted protein [Uncinocarpus reesii 1704]|uniref:Mediator of RNA polymerase II transcription subunit 1 n=1 Tax=Uncinocarpus reesii (strain UAMH 1704) TaxID=336963 RepID=C4JRT0_UNCRE|nr:uncharacterized protein UREG_05169 [Uncinocarpus reesii 1704]EEP80327.1 predicted protein [Uncinocarpus reesii 1704]